jgi:hypothetical protein
MAVVEQLMDCCLDTAHVLGKRCEVTAQVPPKCRNVRLLRYAETQHKNYNKTKL